MARPGVLWQVPARGWRRGSGRMNHLRSAEQLASRPVVCVLRRRAVKSLADAARTAIVAEIQRRDEMTFWLDAFRELAAQMAQVLSGQSPAEMPFRQPTRFRLSINTKAAQKLGVVLPQTLLVSVDEVIE
jgi:hypothetical protein